MVSQAQRREVTRGAVLLAASDLFGNMGFFATTMDQIATSANVAKGAIYHHFSTKEAVFEAVFEVTSENVVRQVDTAGRLARDPLAGISDGTKAYFKICSNGPVGRIILTDGPAVLGWRRWREIDRRHFGAKLPAALKAAIRQGLIADQPVEPLSGLLLGAVTEAAIACANSPAPHKEIERYIAALDTLLEGVRRKD